MADRILVVDDEPEIVQILGRLLTRKGYEVHCEETGEGAWRKMEETVYDLVICDLALEDLSGIELLERVRVTHPTLPFIIITGVGTIESAVKAIQLGAFHYVTKPFKSKEIEILTQRALEYGRLHRRLDDRRLQEAEESTGPMLVASSRSMKELLHRVEKIADSEASVLILGETGTGKSLLARRIHETSSRRDRPFLTIDCAALTETLLESELFGHVKGAFTGAVCAKRGLLEEAQGGTVFLDEICEISPPTQVKLLHAVQEREIKPVGGNISVRIDVRFISATSRDILAEVEAGTFREELYYRLSVIPLYIPPLRARREDIAPLIEYFLERFSKTYKKKIYTITPDALELLMSSPWKGNIRELANVLERGVLLAEGDVLTASSLFTDVPGRWRGSVGTMDEVIPLRQAVEDAEKRAILAALRAAGDNRTEAARLLGISRRALYDKIAAYGLDT